MPSGPGRRPFWYLSRRPEVVASEIDEELAQHLDLRIAALQAQGLTADAARREALRQFGDLGYTREYCRQQDLEKDAHMRRGLMFEELAQDLRIGLRSLRRAPMLTMTILATVGLGIGATTAIFSAVDAALLRPLPYREPAELVRIYTDAPPNRFRFSVADYQALDAQQTQFERVAAYTDRAMAFSDGIVAERLRGLEVTWTYFGLLGLAPSTGRDFTAADGQPGAPPAVIVSHAFWQTRLGGRSDAIGRPIRLDAREHLVVGVLPPRTGPLERGQDFFVAAQMSTPPRKGPFLYTALARLRADADRSAAADELHAINRRMFPLWRASYQDEKATWNLMPLDVHIVGDVRAIAGLSLAAVGLVWLIACANASNLLIARVTSRRQEVAIRGALGASRWRVVRYLLAESSLLALGAAALGLALAWFGIGFLRDFGVGYFPRIQEIALEGRALWLLAALTAASTLLFGLIPAVHGSGGSVDAALRASSRSSTGSRTVRRLRRALVASQFAVATPLIIAAALLLASLDRLGRVDLGFDSRNIVSGSIALPDAQYSEPGRTSAFWDELHRRLAALPSVSTVAFTDGRPPNEVGNYNNFDLEDAPTPPGQSQPVAPWLRVTPDYFTLLGVRLLEGRLLEERDGLQDNLESIVVDRAWAHRFFPGQSAVGKRLREGGCTTCPWTVVVGVVSDVKYAGLGRPDEGAVYWSMAPATRTRYVVLRAGLDPERVLPAVQQVVRELDPNLPLSNVASFDELTARSLQRPRSLSFLVGVFASVALVLSVIGIYGVMAYYVQQHLKDISIRLALGGTRGEVLRLVVGQGMAVVAGGVVVGVAAAYFLTHLMSTLLFGVGATDIVTFAAASGLLLTVALAACLIPAHRATRLQPAAVLRSE